MSRNKKRDLKKILLELEANPNLERACKKVGVIRSTLYRWMKNDTAVKASIDEALEVGRGRYVDISESKLMENIGHGDQRAIEFFLKHNDKRYYTPNVKFIVQKHIQELELKDEQIRQLSQEMQTIWDGVSTENLERLILGLENNQSP